MTFFRILTAVIAIGVLESEAFGNTPAQNKDGAISCGIFHLCQCGDGRRALNCMRKLHPQTLREFFSWTNEECKVVMEEKDNVEDIREKVCKLPTEDQKSCMGIIGDKGIKYSNECSADPTRKNESQKIEDLRMCVSALMGWCKLGTC